MATGECWRSAKLCMVGIVSRWSSFPGTHQILFEPLATDPIMQNPLRSIPSVTELLDSPPLRALVDKASRNVVVSGVRTFLDNLRADVQNAAAEISFPSAAELADTAGWPSRLATGR